MAARASPRPWPTSTVALAKVAVGRDASDQVALDRALIAADGTPNKGKLGANAILGVSLAAAKAAALRTACRYIATSAGPMPACCRFPWPTSSTAASMPTTRSTSRNSWSCPSAPGSFAEGIRMVAEIFHQLKAVLKKAGHNTNVGDEGGFAPNLDNEEAIKFILDADQQGRVHRRDATRTSPSRWTAPARSSSTRAARRATSSGSPRPTRSSPARQMIDLFAGWIEKYPIISHRGPAGPGRLGRLHGVHQGARRARSRSSATTST